MTLSPDHRTLTSIRNDKSLMTNSSLTDTLLVLWDIDGTLLVALDGGGQDDYQEALRWVLPDLALNYVHTHGKTDRQVVTEYLTGAGADTAIAPRVMERLDVLAARFDADAHRIPPLAGVTETLRRMESLGYVNGLLTGNTPARALGKLRASGIDITRISWGESFFGANAFARADMTRAARAKYPARPIVIVGDTPRDGEAAAAAGLPFLGVETGVYSADDLLAAGAFATVADLVTGADDLDRALASVAAV